MKTNIVTALRLVGWKGLALALLAACAACSRDGADVADVEGAGPIADCVAYESAVSTCYHRSLAIADSPTMTPKAPDERAKVAALCRENLQHLTAACR